jgi:hypothetical protein
MGYGPALTPEAASPTWLSYDAMYLRWFFHARVIPKELFLKNIFK